MKSIWSFIKAVWIYLWAIVMTLLLFMPIFTAAFCSRTGNLPFTISKIWARVMLLVSGVRVSITGREHIKEGTSYVVISNHQSLYDIIALVTTLGIQYRWMIKQELLKVPIFGYALYASRNIFVDRSNNERARESIARGVARLPKGVSVLVFAEGTRSSDGGLRDFKKGGFVIALEKHFPILPVTVNGSRRILPKGAVSFRSGRIQVVVGEPIETGDYHRDSMDSLIARTREAVAGNLVPEGAG
ncbi:MAG: 1-acyl-sn-glycerol-3-phosphate acyltransferase [Spirochaetes bacterium]|nr:1-acyl-sn-glycerol-3-phosphate acyltransferase [Spirochaetota bacterium]